MRQIIRKALVDRCDEQTFCFGIVCEECQTEWRSSPRAFSKAGIEPTTEQKQTIFRSLYGREKEWARVRSIEEAVQHFNVCPLCGRLVCDQCFLICDDLDMCASCARKLQERGQAVSL